MRPVKFRAWDGKIMWQSVGFYDNDCGRFISPERGMMGSVDNFPMHPGNPQKESVVLMQFTGLTDRLGKEIWEGDLLKYEDEVAGVYSESFYTVSWSDGGFYLESSEDTEYDMAAQSSFTDHCEVIGNLYEHPDLLR